MAEPYAPLSPPETTGQPRWRGRLFFLSRFIGLLALVPLALWVGLDEVLGVLGRTEPGPVILSVVLVFPLIALKSLRWQALLASQDVPLSTWRAWRLYAMGLSAGALTPGQAGDFAKAWYLRDHGRGLGPALIATLVDRLCDLSGLLLLAAASGLMFAQFVGGPWGVVAALVGVAVVLALLTVERARTAVLVRAVRLLGKDGAGTRWQARAAGPHRQGVALGLALALTAAGFALSFYRSYLLFVALGVALTPGQVVASMSIVQVVSLPFIAGIGSRDVAMVAMLGQWGYPAASALGASTLLLLLNLVNFVVGFLAWAGAPVPARPREEANGEI